MSYSIAVRILLFVLLFTYGLYKISVQDGWEVFEGGLFILCAILNLYLALKEIWQNQGNK